MRNIFLFLLLASRLLAQGSAVIFGTVTDQSGAVVAHADVTATNEETGATETVKSNDAAYYIFPDLRPGSYKITGKMAGFQTIEHPGVVVEVERRTRVDLVMQVGEVKQVLEVLGSASTVDTLTSTIKDVVDSHRMDDLPLNGRNALSLQGILPGAIQMGSGSAATGIALEHQHGFQRERHAPQPVRLCPGWRIGHGHVQQRSGGVPQSGRAAGVFHFAEQLQRRQRAGRRRGGHHGDEVRHESPARRCSTISCETTTWTRGISFPQEFRRCTGTSSEAMPAAPCWLPHYNGHDRTFFFFAYEGTRQVLGQTSSSTVVPTALERTGRLLAELCARQVDHHRAAQHGDGAESQRRAVPQ